MAIVSVLVHAYNYGRFVTEAIESALAQTRAPDEIIVVGDGSTDGTPKILAAHYGHDVGVKVLRQRNCEQLAAFVAGLEHASGD